MVVGHTPLVSHGRQAIEDAVRIMRFKLILDTLCLEKVDFYFSGHNHVLELNKHSCPNGHMLMILISRYVGKI